MIIDIERYRHDAQTVTASQAIAGIAPPENEDRRNLCMELGLDQQAHYTCASPESAAAIYPQLAGYELGVWSHFLTTYYSKDDGMWKGYNFDIIPLDVLEEVRLALALNLFDDVEIWTPERFDRDPMAVGVVGRRPVNPNHWTAHSGRTGNTGKAQFFQIVRWDESLQPFEQIERMVRGRLIHDSHVKLDYLGGKAQERLYDMTRSGDGLMSVDFHLAGLFQRHCGKNCIRVNSRHNICRVCGAPVGKKS